ncbi:MAG: response regulator transcription factor [Panacagrimonas sp.]
MNKTRYHLRSDLVDSGIRMRRSPAHQADMTGASPRALTEQERRVVAELARGLSNRQIARALALSEHTIKFHLKNVFNKLGVRSRMQVVLHDASGAVPLASPRLVPTFGSVAAAVAP